MAGIDVVITPIHIGSTVVWKIKRWARGTPFMGWALIDGTFTPGLNPGLEGEQSMVFRTDAFAIEFAQRQGWNVVGYHQTLAHHASRFTFYNFLSRRK